ncbi:pyrimidine 5'-nucleotidase [Chromatiaceae bacterium AAb-1]|nr:pyrimidine 5'-nucleotidase [Chromatiaceae bacterium AAb-1]
MKYKWILFDADDTLFSFDAYQGLQQMFSRFEYEFSTADFAYYQSINLPLWQQYQQGSINAQQLQHNRFVPWADKLGMSPQQLNAAFLDAMAQICTPLPGARELLGSLSGKVQMGIITNGFTALQQIRLERTGLHGLFNPLVISEQVGAAKPDRIIFEHAFSLMGHPPKAEILMVGDNLHSDIQGGINAGIATCWLNRHGHEKTDDIEPDYQVSSLTELQQLLLAS